MKRALLAAVSLVVAAVPATASAATIEMTTATDGSRTIAYEARRGEVNALGMFGTVGGGFDLRMAFFEHAAPLTPGPGCEGRFPVICGAVDDAFPVHVSLGDRGDVANVNSFTERLSLLAGSGNDDVLAGGTDASADGGSGNDTIHVAANNGATGDGGSGRDRVTGGLGAVAAILDGGSGADLLVPDASLFNSADGGTGDDQLVAFRGREIRFAGGDGDDVLVSSATGAPMRLDGGDDDDLVFAQAGGAAVDAGSGNDIVVVQGGAGTASDTVACGAGWDVAWADGDDAVAADCELKLRIAAPSFRKVTAAQTAAQALLAHRPDPARR